jgi:arylsulfatase A-like enzyme
MPELGDVWNNPEIEGQRPIPPGTVTVATLLRAAGYVTAGFGKWGLGGPGSTGLPNRQGFDYWYGYLCQRHAHNYYPTHLWRDGSKEMIEGNAYFSPHQKLPENKDPKDGKSYEPYKGRHYSFDLTLEAALRFIRESRNRPFFLYLPFTIPHLALQVPEDSLAQYADAFPEKPYTGEDRYLPHPKPRAAYAAMISRLDRGVGRLIETLEQCRLTENTLVCFTSDNGPACPVGGVDTQFFESAGPFRACKGAVYEGGIRVPLIARWPGTIRQGRQSDHVSALWDFLPTFTELAQVPTPGDIDGVSLLPTLLEQRQRPHEYLYWEHLKKMQAVRLGDWKGVRLSPQSEIELYDLKTDVGEKNNVAAANPDVVNEMRRIFREGRTDSELFPLG